MYLAAFFYFINLSQFTYPFLDRSVVSCCRTFHTEISKLINTKTPQILWQSSIYIISTIYKRLIGMNMYYIQTNHWILIYLPLRSVKHEVKGIMMASSIDSLTKSIIGANIATQNSLRNVIYGLASQWRLIWAASLYTDVRAVIMPTTKNGVESSQCGTCGKWKTAPSKAGIS